MRIFGKFDLDGARASTERPLTPFHDPLVVSRTMLANERFIADQIIERIAKENTRLNGNMVATREVNIDLSQRLVAEERKVKELTENPRIVMRSDSAIIERLRKARAQKKKAIEERDLKAERLAVLADGMAEISRALGYDGQRLSSVIVRDIEKMKSELHDLRAKVDSTQRREFSVRDMKWDSERGWIPKEWQPAETVTLFCGNCRFEQKVTSAQQAHDLGWKFAHVFGNRCRKCAPRTGVKMEHISESPSFNDHSICIAVNDSLMKQRDAATARASRLEAAEKARVEAAKTRIQVSNRTLGEVALTVSTNLTEKALDHMRAGLLDLVRATAEKQAGKSSLIDAMMTIGEVAFPVKHFDLTLKNPLSNYMQVDFPSVQFEPVETPKATGSMSVHFGAGPAPGADIRTGADIRKGPAREVCTCTFAAVSAFASRGGVGISSERATDGWRIRHLGCGRFLGKIKIERLKRRGFLKRACRYIVP